MFESKNVWPGMAPIGNVHCWQHQHRTDMLMQCGWKMNLTEKFKKLSTEQLVAEGQLWDLVWFHYLRRVRIKCRTET